MNRRTAPTLHLGDFQYGNLAVEAVAAADRGKVEFPVGPKISRKRLRHAATPLYGVITWDNLARFAPVYLTARYILPVLVSGVICGAKGVLFTRCLTAPFRGFPSPLIPCPAKPEPQWRLQNKRKNSQRKHKSMFTNKVQTNSPNRGAAKSTRQKATLPSDADIATKAYEIWLARGQESGNDQQHWFEAKRQLQLV